jgi:hypothetical protein
VLREALRKAGRLKPDPTRRAAADDTDPD